MKGQLLNSQDTLRFRLEGRRVDDSLISLQYKVQHLSVSHLFTELNSTENDYYNYKLYCQCHLIFSVYVIYRKYI